MRSGLFNKGSYHLLMQVLYYFVCIGWLHTFVLCDHWKQKRLWIRSNTNFYLKSESKHITPLVNFLKSTHWLKLKNINSHYGQKKTLNDIMCPTEACIFCHSSHSPHFLYTNPLSLPCFQDSHMADSSSFRFQFKCQLLERSSLAKEYKTVFPHNPALFSLSCFIFFIT